MVCESVHVDNLAARETTYSLMVQHQLCPNVADEITNATEKLKSGLRGDSSVVSNVILREHINPTTSPTIWLKISRITGNPVRDLLVKEPSAGFMEMLMNVLTVIQTTKANARLTRIVVMGAVVRASGAGAVSAIPVNTKGTAKNEVLLSLRRAFAAPHDEDFRSTILFLSNKATVFEVGEILIKVSRR